jgi:hypothetical protein
MPVKSGFPGTDTPFRLLRRDQRQLLLPARHEAEVSPILPSVPTENSVRIDQHPCGTLIADLVDALSLLASTPESKGWQSLPRPGVECI